MVNLGHGGVLFNIRHLAIVPFLATAGTTQSREGHSQLQSPELLCSSISFLVFETLSFRQCRSMYMASQFRRRVKIRPASLGLRDPPRAIRPSQISHAKTVLAQDAGCNVGALAALAIRDDFAVAG